MSFLESWIFSRNQNSPNARPDVSYCLHFIACNPNLHEFNQKGIRVLWWAAPPQHEHGPASQQSLNGIILVSRSWRWRVSPVSGNEEGIRACHDQLTPTAFITCQQRPGLFLLFDFWLSFSASKLWDQRETLNFQNITSSGRKLDQICLTEIKFLIHSI